MGIAPPLPQPSTICVERLSVVISIRSRAPAHRRLRTDRLKSRDGFPEVLAGAEPMPSRESAEPNGSPLCLSCGLCCSGVLHSHAVVKPEEITFARALGLTIRAFQNVPGFLLPCHLHRERGCSVYGGRRPAICVGYECDLLRRYLVGALTLEQCAVVVQRVRELLGDVIPWLPTGYSFARLRQELDESWDSERGVFGSVEWRRANPELLLAITKLAMYSRRHFGSTREFRAS
jgi:hypothetical protein